MLVHFPHSDFLCLWEAGGREPTLIELHLCLQEIDTFIHILQLTQQPQVDTQDIGCRAGAQISLDPQHVTSETNHPKSSVPVVDLVMLVRPVAGTPGSISLLAQNVHFSNIFTVITILFLPR